MSNLDNKSSEAASPAAETAISTFGDLVSFVDKYRSSISHNLPLAYVVLEMGENGQVDEADYYNFSEVRYDEGNSIDFVVKIPFSGNTQAPSKKCEHTEYQDGHCAEMICPNYVNKHIRLEDTEARSNQEPRIHNHLCPKCRRRTDVKKAQCDDCKNVTESTDGHKHVICNNCHARWESLRNRFEGNND